MNTIKVNVSFEKRIIYKTGVDITTRDYNSTKLEFEFDRKDGRKVFEMKDPDGNLVLLTDIVNNEVKLVGKDKNGNNASLFNQAGKYIFEISLYDGESKLTSAFNYINVKQEQIEVDGEVITPYLPIFDNLINEVEKVSNTIINNGDGTKYLSDDGTYKFVQGGGTGEGNNEVYIGTNEPTEESVEIWINPNGEATTIPTKTSELENDSGFLTEHQDLSSYALKEDIPNVSDYITKDVSNLTNYYDKNSIDTMIGDIETLLGGI